MARRLKARINCQDITRYDVELVGLRNCYLGFSKFRKFRKISGSKECEEFGSSRSVRRGGGFGNDRPISSPECVNVLVSVNVIGRRNTCCIDTFHSFLLLYLLLFCDTHDLVCEMISVFEKRIQICIVKIVENVFKKNIEGGLFLAIRVYPVFFMTNSPLTSLIKITSNYP